MRFLPSALLAGVGVGALAAGSPPVQQPLQEQLQQQQQQQQPILHEASQKLLGSLDGIVPEHILHRLASTGEGLRGLTAEARAAWEEVYRTFPDALARAKHALPPPPKKPTKKKPASFWDHIVRGAEVKREFRVQGAGKGKGKGDEAPLDGELDQYNLRVRKADPSVLNVDPAVKQYSGYLDDEENDKHLFYWFFESRNDPENDPVVLWLNGGPGCSSMLGMLMELGPSWINESIVPDYNPHSWNSNASVLFLDQPVNTGFSYSGSGVYDTFAAGKDVYALLTLFFSQFPQYASQAFHIAGESYGGHYVPVFASEILSHANRNINLQSIMIGNGLTDGYTQYEYYRPFACGEGVWPRVLDEPTCRGMDNALPRCQSLVESCYQSESLWSCVPATIYCNNAMIGPFQSTGLNIYDVREKCKDPEHLCYPALGYIVDWLNLPEVMAALGAEVDGFDSCTGDVHRGFLLSGDWMKPIHLLVPDILDQIPVLVYAGDADYICNYMGNWAWPERLDWPGKQAYNDAELEDWSVAGDDEPVGKVKSSGNLTYLTVHAAGHMAPHDKPEASLEMLNRWIGGNWLDAKNKKKN